MMQKDVQDRIIYHLESFKISNENAREIDMGDVSFKNVMKRHNKMRVNHPALRGRLNSPIE